MKKKQKATVSQEEREEAIYQSLKEKGDQTLRAIAHLLASKQGAELFGKTEFELRDLVHDLGAASLETAANLESKKGVSGS